MDPRVKREDINWYDTQYIPLQSSSLPAGEVNWARIGEAG
jgi:hypothetical protein